MSRRTIVLASLGGAVAIHLAFMACGSSGMLTDAGGFDSESDAIAQDSGPGGSTAIAANCDQLQTYMTVSSGTTTTQNSWWADVSIPGLNPRDASHISAVVCDPDRSPGYPYGTCPMGTTCTPGGFVPPTSACRDAPASLLDTGRIVVFCGSGSSFQTSSGTSNSTYEHYLHAFVRVN